eukprot:403358455
MGSQNSKLGLQIKKEYSLHFFHTFRSLDQLISLIIKSPEVDQLWLKQKYKQSKDIKSRKFRVDLSGDQISEFRIIGFKTQLNKNKKKLYFNTKILIKLRSECHFKKYLGARSYYASIPSLARVEGDDILNSINQTQYIYVKLRLRHYQIQRLIAYSQLLDKQNILENHCLEFSQLIRTQNILVYKKISDTKPYELIEQINKQKSSNEVFISNDYKILPIREYIQKEHRVKVIIQRLQMMTDTLIKLENTSERQLYLEQSNQVIRRHFTNVDKFLKIKFLGGNQELELLNDQYMRIKGDYQIRRNLVTNLLWNILGYGISINNKTFKFLGYSNSQLKDRSFWFLRQAVENDLKLNSAIMSMYGIVAIPSNLNKKEYLGEVLNCHGKVANNYTSSDFIIKLERNQIQVINDIVRHDYQDNRDFNFTDGNGLISQKLSNMINQHYGLKNCSVYQVRIGGAKGTLTVDQRLKGKKVILRSSMIKLKNNITDLNIVQCGKAGLGYSNRQVIALFEHDGVHKEEFFELIKKNIQYQFFKQLSQGQAQSVSYYDLAFLEQHLTHLVGAFKYFIRKKPEILRYDPLFQSIVNQLKQEIMRQITEKGRIYMKNSVVLLGVPDFLGILQENEIFLQIPKYNDLEQGEQYQVIRGDVVVTRNPALHPNDIRKLVAVDRPEFRYLRNAVVFSTQGSIPPSTMMAGGDHDGDRYLIIWERSIVNNFLANQIRYKYFDPKRLMKKGRYNIQPQMIASSIVKYVRSDYLGLIDSMHLGLCDYLGPNHDFTLYLEYLHRQAVDYSKHGKAPNIKQFLLERIRLNYDRKQPLFMSSMIRSQNHLRRCDIFDSNKTMSTIYKMFHSSFASDKLIMLDWSTSIMGIFDRVVRIEERDLYQFARHLPAIYKEIVEPMTQDIKTLMLYFGVHQEMHLFCPKKFKRYETQFYQNSGDYKKILVQKLENIVLQYTSKIINLNQKIKLSREHFGQAIYYLTYLDISANQQTQCRQKIYDLSFLVKYQPLNLIQQPLKDLLNIKQKELQKLQNDTIFKNNVYNYIKYRCIVEEVEKGQREYLQRLLKFKRIFCVPWLLCYDYIS